MKAIVHHLVKHAAFAQWAWFLIIFVLCATPGEYIPSNNWLELLSFDKLVHASIFFVLTSLFMLRHFKKGRSQLGLLLLFLFCVFYGASLEWMQAEFFRNRSADWKDIIANSFGCLVALILSKKIKQLVQQSLSAT